MANSAHIQNDTIFGIQKCDHFDDAIACSVDLNSIALPHWPDEVDTVCAR